MKRNIIIVLFIVVSIVCHAQVPGYMGKKVTIAYSTLLHPNAFSYFYSANLEYSKPIFTHSLNMNIVVGKSREIGLSLRYSNRKISNTYFKTQYPQSIVPAFERFGMMEYAVSIKRFSKARFAPIGIYSRWEVFYLTGKLKYDSYQAMKYNILNGEEELTSFGHGEMNFYGGGGAYSLGKQRIFKDKYVIDFGFRPSLMIVSFGDERTVYEEHLSQDIRVPLTLTPIMNVYAGIGFLAF